MVDLGATTTVNSATTSTSAASAMAAPVNISSSNPTPSNQVFSLSARILAARETLPETRSNPQNTNQQIDPALLARIALEEELKRQGGGGGGGPRFTSPTLFVLYSMRLINDAMRQAYEALQKALDQSGQNISVPVNNAVAVVQEALAKFISNPVFVNLGTAINQSFLQIGKMLDDPAATATKLANNVAQFGSVVASAIANGLKRLFYGKEEDRLDPDNEIYQGEAGLLDKALSFLGMIDNEASGSNAKNIKAHIDNLANQVTRWAASINYPFKEFTKRWFR